jgi:hypothetical protein
MPVLPTPFTAQVGDAPISGGRRATGEDFGTAAGTELGGAVRSAANQFVSDIEESESRKALVASTQIRAKYANELDKAALSGADLGALKEKMTAELTAVGDGFQTKRGVDSLAQYTANTALMYDEQANHIQVQRAAANARLEGSKFLNGAAAIIQSNPLYLGQAIKDAETLAGTFTGIRPEQRAEIADGLKKELNMAAALGATRIDPEGTKKKLDAGEWDLTPEQRNQAINKADTELRAKRADESYARERARQERKDANDKAYDSHLKDILNGGNGKSVRRSIMDDPTLEPQTREHLILMMEHRAKELAGEEKRSNPATVRDLWVQITSGQMYNTDAIVAAVQRGDVNVRDASFLVGTTQAQKDDNGRTFSSRLNGRIQTVNAAMRSSPVYQAQPELASAIQLEMVSQVERQAADFRKANKDPTVLLDPDSKDYYFTPNRIKTVAEDVQRRSNEALGTEVKVASPADILNLPDGAVAVDAKGNRYPVNAAQKEKIRKMGGGAAPVDDRQAWLNATGGALQPGETQAQAIERWKKAR